MKIKRLKTVLVFLLVATLVCRADIGAAYGSLFVQAADGMGPEDVGSNAEDISAAENEEEQTASGETEADSSKNEEIMVPQEPEEQAAEDQEKTRKPAASQITAASYTGKNVNNKIKKSTLGIKNADGEELSALTNVQWDIGILMTFEMTLETDDNTVFREGDYIELTVPKEIKVDALEGNQGDVKEKDKVIAKVKTEQQKLTMTFTDEIEDSDYVDVNFTISAKFNQEMLEEGGERELAFEVEGGTTFKVTVDFEEVDMKARKKLVHQNESNGVYYQEWRLTVNTEGKELHGPVVKDIIPAGVAYVSHRFENQDNWNASVSSDKRNVTFTYNGVLRNSDVIYVTTCAADFMKIETEKDSDGNVTSFVITNKVTLDAVDKNGKTLTPVSAQDTAKFSPEWIVKNGNFSIIDKSISWALDVNQERLNLATVKIRDVIPKGLTLDESSLEVLKDGTEKITGYTYSLTTQADGTSVLVIDLGNIGDYYKINYETKVYDDFFKEQNKETFKNIVSMEWMADGIGYKTPDVNSSVTAQNTWIEKSGGYWWPRRLYNEWVITINPNQNPISGEVKIVDVLPGISSNGFQQIFNEERYRAEKWNDKDWLRATKINADGTTEVLKKDVHYTYKIENGGKELNLMFENGVVDKSKIILYLESEIPEGAPLSAVISNTQAGTYTNRVRMYNSSGVELGTDTHGQWTSRRISEKSHVKYEQASRTATWRVEVNPYRHTGIGALTVRDELPEFMAFIKGGNTVTVYETEITQRSGGKGDTNYTSPGGYSDEVTTITDRVLESGYKYEVSEDESVVTFDFEKDTIEGKSYIIEFTSTVTDEFYSVARESTTFTNYSYTSVEGLDGEWEASASMSAKLTSTPLQKKGTYHQAEGTFTWEVLINQDAVDVDFSGVVLEDQLQEGLVLDIATIRLEKKNGSGWDAVTFDKNQSIAYDYETNLFTFKVPDDLATKTTYRLTFDTDILKSGTYSNSISMKGYLGSDPEYKASGATVSVTEFDGKALTSKKLRISLKKTDINGKALSGAVFELRTADGTVLETGKSGIDGQIAFQSLLSRQTRYYLYEVEAPTGYRAKKNPIEVYINVDSSGNAVAADLTYTAVNEKIYVPVTLKKTNTNGTPLFGAEFSVTPFYWEYHSDGSRTPIAEMPYDKKYTSGSDGNINLGSLPFGLYAVQEERAPDGYMVSDSFLVVEITYPKTAADGAYRVLYWDVTENSDGSYEYTQRTAEGYGDKITHVVNEEQLYKLTIYKTDKDNGRPLADTGFEIYQSDKQTKNKGVQIENPDRTDNVFMTDTYGRIEVYLPAGYYLAEEVAPPRGYTIGTETIQYKEATAVYTPPSGAMADAVYTAPQFQVNFENKRITETVTFRKTDEAGSILKNARFNLYKLDTDEQGDIISVPTLDDAVRVITSDDDGKVTIDNLTEGLYALQETIAPAGYVRSLDIYAIELKLSADGKSLETTYYKIEGGTANLDLSDWDKYRADVIAQNMKDKGYYDIVNEKEVLYYNLTIYKRETGTEIPLSGAVFEIYENNGSGQPGAQITFGADENGWYTTNYAGEINVQLPKGDYILEEIQAPEGYAAASERTKVSIDGKQINYKVFVYNKKLTKDVSFTKVDAADSKVLPEARFNFYQFYPENFDQKTDLPLYDETLQFELRGTIDSSKNGELVLENLGAGWYALQEVNPPVGYIRSLDMYVIHLDLDTDGKELEKKVYVIEGGMQNWEKIKLYDRADIPNTLFAPSEPGDPNNQLVLMKRDDAGNAMAGISFYVKDEKGQYIYKSGSQRLRLTTNGLGIAEYEGALLEAGKTYTFEEYPVPKGYRVDEKTITVEIKAEQVNYLEVVNKAVTADVAMNKKNQSGNPIAGASFNIYKIDAKRQGDSLILDTSSGSYMEYDRMVKSEKDGTIKLGSLAYGFYAIQEAEAAEGYQRNLEEIIGIEIAADGKVYYYRVNRANHAEFELLEEYDKTIYNDYEGHNVRILKEDATNLLPLSGAVFEIYEYDKKAEGKGNKIITSGASADGTYTTDARGEIHVSLPAGTYLLEETEAPYMYRARSGTDKEAESYMVEVTGDVNEITKEITNDPILTSVEMTKISDDGELLAGAEFNLYALQVSVDGEKLVYKSDEYLRMLKSDKNGRISVADLSYGWYALQEAAAPEGYIRSLDVLAFYIAPDSSGQTTVTYYDIFGGMVNVECYQQRTAAESENILLRNERMDGEYYPLNIRKIHRFTTGDGAEDITGLAGARFRIRQTYDGKKVQIVTAQADADGLYTTDTYGQIKVELKPGSYLVEEVEAPTGYQNASKLVTVVVSKDSNDTIVIEVENTIDTKLDVNKVDQDQKSLNGAVFTLYRKIYTTSDGADYHYAEEGIIDMKDCSSETIQNLRSGEYVLMETEAPEGYQRSTDIYEFAISADEREWQFDIENTKLSGGGAGGGAKAPGDDGEPDQKEPDDENADDDKKVKDNHTGKSGGKGSLIKTGDTAPIILYVVVLAAAVVVIGYLVWKRRRK